MIMTSAALCHAYRHTIYVADHPAGEICLRIGERHARLDTLLRALDYDTWAFVSACNPRSRPLAPTENAARHEALLAHVGRLGLPCFPGRGVADDGGWAEESLLILGIDAQDAAALGAIFEQNAVVVGRRGGVAELRWCAKRAPDKLAD